MKITTEIRGLDETLANIRRLGQAFSNEVEEKALKGVARPMAEEIANRVDADHHLTGLTGADIGFAPSKVAREEGTAAVLVGAHRGGRGRAFVLSLLEFGTFRTPGFHIVATTFRNHSGSFVPTVTKELRDAFTKTRAKFLKRAA